MPSGILLLLCGSRWVILRLRRIWSWIAAGVGRSLRRLELRWHVARARAELRRLGVRVPAGVWFCDGCSQVLWDLDSFLSHTRMHTG